MAFDTIKIMELPSATQVVEDDYLVVEQPDKTKKATVSQVISDLDLANKSSLTGPGGAGIIGTEDGEGVQKSLDTDRANTRELWRRALHDLGLTLVDGSFEEGATLTYTTDAIWHMSGAQCYTWSGTFPKSVPAGSTPSTTGSGWITVGGLSLLDEVTEIKNEAVEAKDQAEDARDEAQAYALQSSGLGNLYASVSEGLAATTDGQYFQVPQGSGSSVAFKVYKNTTGVAQEVAQVPGTAAITGTIREFPTLAAAQADADAGNISEGATTFVRSTDDSSLAIEYQNISGTLTATGRTMPSAKFVIAEIKARSALISDVGAADLLSICDEFGYVGPRITESSLETVNLKIVRNEEGPVLALFDDYGNAVQLVSEKGNLVAGKNEIGDSENIFSFPDSYGNEIVLIDKFGRQRIGNDIVIDAPGWAELRLDEFGYVIYGYKNDGTYIGPNSGGSNTEPVPSVLETGSLAHWLFGYENTSLTSRVSAKLLTPQSTPEFNQSYISLPAWGGALISDIPESGEYTVCSVVRLPSQGTLTDSVVIYGTQDGYAERDDDDTTYTGNQLSLFSDRTDRRWVRSKISGYRATSRRYPTTQPPVGQWLFVTHVVKLTGEGERYQVISIGSDYQKLREADTDRLILSGRNFAVGNAYCDIPMFKTKGLDIAECIYFDHALSSQEIKSVYLNSRQRMAERSINLQ